MDPLNSSIQHFALTATSPTPVTSTAPINRIPDDLLSLIFKNLDPISQQNTRLTCRRFSKVFQNDYYTFARKQMNLYKKAISEVIEPAIGNKSSPELENPYRYFTFKTKELTSDLEQQTVPNLSVEIPRKVLKEFEGEILNLFHQLPTDLTTTIVQHLVRNIPDEFLFNSTRDGNNALVQFNTLETDLFNQTIFNRNLENIDDLNFPRLTEEDGDTIRGLAPSSNEYIWLLVTKYVRLLGNLATDVHPTLGKNALDRFDMLTDLEFRIREEDIESPDGFFDPLINIQWTSENLDDIGYLTLQTMYLLSYHIVKRGYTTSKVNQFINRFIQSYLNEQSKNEFRINLTICLVYEFFRNRKFKEAFELLFSSRDILVVGADLISTAYKNAPQDIPAAFEAVIHTIDDQRILDLAVIYVSLYKDDLAQNPQTFPRHNWLNSDHRSSQSPKDVNDTENNTTFPDFLLSYYTLDQQDLQEINPEAAIWILFCLQHELPEQKLINLIKEKIEFFDHTLIPDLIDCEKRYQNFKASNDENELDEITKLRLKLSEPIITEFKIAILNFCLNYDDEYEQSKGLPNFEYAFFFARSFESPQGKEKAAEMLTHFSSKIAETIRINIDLHKNELKGCSIFFLNEYYNALIWLAALPNKTYYTSCLECLKKMMPTTNDHFRLLTIQHFLSIKPELRRNRDYYEIDNWHPWAKRLRQESPDD